MKLVAALVTLYLVWGSTYLAFAVTNRSLPPLLMLSVRFLIAGAILYGWAHRRGHLRAERPTGRQWRAAFVVGGLLLVVDTGAIVWAEQRVASGTTALLVATVPLFIALIDRVFFGIKLGVGAVAGIATGLLGVGLLVGPSANIDLLGAGVILAASFAWAVGSVYGRVAAAPKVAFVGAGMQMLCAGVLLGIAGIAMGELSRVHLGAVSAASYAAFGFLVVFGSLIAFTAFGWLLKNASTTLLSTYAYVNPVVAVFLGWALVGEHVGGKELAAGAVIVSSVALLIFGREPRTAAAPVAKSTPIRAKHLQTADFPRSGPRLGDLGHIAA